MEPVEGGQVTAGWAVRWDEVLSHGELETESKNQLAVEQRWVGACVACNVCARTVVEFSGRGGYNCWIWLSQMIWLAGSDSV